jgi:hypothetical protein
MANKIWAYRHAVDCAQDWLIDPTDCVDIGLANVAAVPVMFNEPQDFSYLPGNESIDLSGFDLVLISDIEYRPQHWIDEWIEKNNIKRWAMLRGGIDLGVSPASNSVYRPWWIYNRDLRYNQYQDVNHNHKPYCFDVLLGSRRPNRDFVMLSMQQHELLDKNIVTYRDVFPGSALDRRTDDVFTMFDNADLQWPYVSANLDPAWEVSDHINNAVSQTVPWKIYQHTKFTIACESVCTGSVFFMAEKISKPMFARRPFVVFGIKGFLKTLRSLGYHTFHPVIDESYDDIENDLERWQAAFEQVIKLHDANHREVYDKLECVLDHNHQWLQDCGTRARQDIMDLKQSILN